VGSMSRNKGKRGEREAADALNQHFGECMKARRGVQFKGGPESPDVSTALDNHLLFEVKRTERFKLYDAIDQARADGGGKPSVVLHRSNGRPWVAVIRLDDLEAVAEILANREDLTS